MAMPTPAKTHYTYADLEHFPDDNLRREVIGGDLFVSPSPRTRHQGVVAWLTAHLFEYAREHGGRVFPAPLDVFFADTDVVEPDVLFLTAVHIERIEEKFIRGAPDVVVEVSSPSTRRLELVRKRDLYERHGVPEYWYVDLEVDRVERYSLNQGGYRRPELLDRADVLESPLLPGLTLSVDDLLGPPEQETKR